MVTLFRLRRGTTPIPAPKTKTGTLLEETLAESDTRLAEARATLAGLRARLADADPPSAAQLREAADEVAYAEERRGTAVQRARARQAVDHAARLAILKERHDRRDLDRGRVLHQAARRVIDQYNQWAIQDNAEEAAIRVDLRDMLHETQELDRAAGQRERFGKLNYPPEWDFLGSHTGQGIRIGDRCIVHQSPLLTSGGFAEYVPRPPHADTGPPQPIFACEDDQGMQRRSHALLTTDVALGGGRMTKVLRCIYCGMVSDTPPPPNAA